MEKILIIIHSFCINLLKSNSFKIFYYKYSFFWNIKGILACLDGYMNIALEQTEEYVNGQLKNKYGDAFIRGNNGIITKYIKIYYTYLNY